MRLYEEVYALYALNELNTYRYSVSFAGAGGMVQMIPSTYQMIRRMHPGVGLNPDFVAGMRNHGNALEAMLLYMQDTWNGLAASPDVIDALADRIGHAAGADGRRLQLQPRAARSYIAARRRRLAHAHPARDADVPSDLQSLESLIPIKSRA